MTANRDLMTKAREDLKDNWPNSIVAYLIYMLITSIGGPIALIVTGPMQVGSALFSLEVAKNKKSEIELIVGGFKDFVRSLITFLLVALFTFLWLLLFIIPGIIAAISYSQAFYILATDKDINPSDAIKKSKELMRGNKWKFFCLGFRFIGWFILAVLTLGIGFLWLIPYMQVTYAEFYLDLTK